MPPELEPEPLLPHPAASRPTAASATSATNGRRSSPDLLGGDLLVPFQTRTCVASFAGPGPCLVAHQLLWSPVSSRLSTDDDAQAAWCRRGEHQTSPPVCRDPGLPASSNRRRRRRRRRSGAWPSASTAAAVAFQAKLVLRVSKVLSTHWRQRPSDPTRRGSPARSGRSKTAPWAATSCSKSANSPRPLTWGFGARREILARRPSSSRHRLRRFPGQRPEVWRSPAWRFGVGGSGAEHPRRPLPHEIPRLVPAEQLVTAPLRRWAMR
jgi:hypothetical protein